MTINWFYLRVEDIVSFFYGSIVASLVTVTIGTKKIKITDSWGKVWGLYGYLKNNRGIKALEYKTSDALTKAIKGGTVKSGAVVLQYSTSGESIHAVMIGRLLKSSGRAYYYGHTRPADAYDDQKSIHNLISSNRKIYVFNMQ